MGRQPCLGKHISYLFHVDFKGAKRLTLWTGTSFHLLVLGLEKGSQDEAALAAVVFDHAELRQDPCATRHYSAGADQLIQVQLPEERQRDAGCLQGTEGRTPYRNVLATRHNSQRPSKKQLSAGVFLQGLCFTFGDIGSSPLIRLFSCNKLSHPVGLIQSFSLQTSS